MNFKEGLPFHGTQPLNRVLAIILTASFFGIAGCSKSDAPYRFNGNAITDPQPAKDFELIGPDGSPLRLSHYKGKVVVLEFGFAHCPNVCPMALANSAAFYRRLTPEEQREVQVLFVTVDPERDTAKILRDYVPFFDPAFVGLTGSPQQIETAKKEFGVYSRKVPLHEDIPSRATALIQKEKPMSKELDDYTVDHSALMYVLDRKGRLRVTYGHDELSNGTPILADIRHLLDESN